MNQVLSVTEKFRYLVGGAGLGESFVENLTETGARIGSEGLTVPVPMVALPTPDHHQRAEWLRVIAAKNRELEQSKAKIAALEAELAAERARSSGMHATISG